MTLLSLFPATKESHISIHLSMYPPIYLPVILVKTGIISKNSVKSSLYIFYKPNRLFLQSVNVT